MEILNDAKLYAIGSCVFNSPIPFIYSPNQQFTLTSVCTHVLSSSPTMH